MAELHAMQQIEPTGAMRMEWYLARLITAVKQQWSNKPLDWRHEIIGYETPQQTPEEIMDFFNAATATVPRTDGNDSES